MSVEKQILQKIYKRIDIHDDDTLCWRYNGDSNGKEYGRIYARGKVFSVHRLIYEIFFGPIPSDKEVHHVCGVRSCCNPAHLELVTHRENAARTRAYEKLRLERLRLLLDMYPQIELVSSIAVASTELAALWNARSDNMPCYLDTLEMLYDGQFKWQMIELGRGPKPSIFRIRIEPELIDQLQESEVNFYPMVKKFNELLSMTIAL